jgi:hypothetical protein
MRAKQRKKQVGSALLEREHNLDPADLVSHPKMQAESAVAAEIIEWLEKDITSLVSLLERCQP